MPPLSLLIKPASGSCNLRCRYCFYADEAEKRSCASFGRISMDTMQVLADKTLAYTDRSCVLPSREESRSWRAWISSERRWCTFVPIPTQSA